MRAFLAIELPHEVTSALADLNQRLASLRVQGLRLVRPEGTHVTLKFLGDISEEQTYGISSAVSSVARVHRTFVLRLAAAGAFPDPEAPRVLWVGVDGELPPLMALQRHIESSLEPLGFAPDKREFNPHLTVARIRTGTPGPERHRATEVLFASHSRPGLSFAVESVSLIQSRLLSGGAVYQRVASMPLAPRPDNEKGP